jgi:hypothetical protein
VGNERVSRLSELKFDPDLLIRAQQQQLLASILEPRKPHRGPRLKMSNLFTLKVVHQRFVPSVLHTEQSCLPVDPNDNKEM